MTVEATPADVRKMAEYMVKKSKRLTGENCCDDYGFTWGPASVLFRYSRMKFGSHKPAWSALGLWLDVTLGGLSEPLDDDWGETSPQSRGGEVLIALSHAAQGKFDPDLLT